jgi:phosphoribosyl-ATP pyrophosphohydrolase/phosphoribosyl-AMP cyclohydrolase
MRAVLTIRYDEAGLVPVIVQDELTGAVRMMAWANEAAVKATRETHRATFFSRSRNELWEKGKTSGNSIEVSSIIVDCDEDTLIYRSKPTGPSCHTGQTSCFFRDESGAPASAAPFMDSLDATCEARKSATGEKSYTKSLYERGPGVIGDKIREEANEMALALECESDDRVKAEAADVIFHVLVGLKARGLGWRDVLQVLEARTHQSGLSEKAARPSQKP